jgi:hypothetical protein
MVTAPSMQTSAPAMISSRSDLMRNNRVAARAAEVGATD